MSGEVLLRLLLWSLVATVAMTTILHASEGFGYSRLSLPFLVGTFFTGDRSRAVAAGFSAYTLGGSLFALLYFWVFVDIGFSTWWLGALLGLLHALFLLGCALTLLPYVHPRMASEHDGPSGDFLLEPPGFMGLNYGRGTPMTLVLGQTVYGATLGMFARLPATMMVL